MKPLSILPVLLLVSIQFFMTNILGTTKRSSLLPKRDFNFELELLFAGVTDAEPA